MLCLSKMHYAGLVLTGVVSV